MASPAPTQREVDSLFRMFDHDLANFKDNDKKNINACILYLKKNVVKGVPTKGHFLFAHKGAVELVTWAKFENYFINPTTKTDYIRNKDKHYLVGSPLIDQKMNNKGGPSTKGPINATNSTPSTKRPSSATKSTSSASNVPIRPKPSHPAVVHSQFQASSSRAPSPAPSDRSKTQSLPPVPAEQKLQVAEYIVKEKGLAGMHLIFAKVRLPAKWGGTGQDEDAASLDVCYDTGSTIQVLHINNHWKHIGGSNYNLTKGRMELKGSGGIMFLRDSVMVELKVFKDIEHKIELTGWFEAEASLGNDDESLLSGLEMVAKQGLMFASVSANTKLLVAHENHKLALAWKVWTS